MTMQREFSRWGAFFLIGMALAGLIGVWIGYQAKGNLRLVEFLTGLGVFLLGMAVFSKFELPWETRLGGAALVWVGSGLALGTLATDFLFLWVGAVLLVGAFILDDLVIGFLLAFLPKELWLAIAWLLFAPLFTLWLLRPLQSLQSGDILLGLAVATMVNIYWVGRWYSLYREPCRPEAVIHTAVNLTAIWLYDIWLIIGVLDKTIREPYHRH